MRTEQTLDLTSAGASFTGVVAGDTQSIPYLSAQPPRPVARHTGVESLPRADDRVMDGDAWKVDEHWTAVSAYLADLYLPNEG